MKYTISFHERRKWEILILKTFHWSRTSQKGQYLISATQKIYLYDAWNKGIFYLMETHCSHALPLSYQLDIFCRWWEHTAQQQHAFKRLQLMFFVLDGFNIRKWKRFLFVYHKLKGEIYGSSDVQIFLRCCSVCFTVKSVYYKKAHKFALACNAFIYRCFNRCTCTKAKQRCTYIHKYRWRYSVLSLATEDVDTNQ